MSLGEREPLLKGVVDLKEEDSFEVVSKNEDRESAAQKSRKNAKFNILFFWRFWCVLRVAVPRVCSRSMLLLVLLVLIRAAEEYNYYQVGILPSRFYAALTGKSLPEFKDILWKMVIIVVSLCICKSGGELVAGLVLVQWRKTISEHLHGRYFSQRLYYQLNVLDHQVDNPDQRITQDVNRFCEEVSQALPKLILQPFLIAYYSYRTLISLGWYGVLGIYGFFVLSTIFNKFIMGPIVSYVFLQEQREGDYRFHHVQVRANAESIAFYRGGILEGKKSNQCLQLLLQAQLSSVHWQLPLNFAVFMFDYVSSIISYSLVGVAIFSGKYDSFTPSQLASAVSENTFFSMYLLNSFSTVVDTAVKFAEIAGYTHRIGHFLEVIKRCEKKREKQLKAEERDPRASQEELSDSCKEQDKSPDSGTTSINQTGVSLLQSQSVDNDVVARFQDVAISSPGDFHPLVEGLSLEFKRGRNMLIMGETGTGKSSIFRVLSQLWKPLRGVASLCVENSVHYVMFLPQRSHLTSGTLADQVAFPERPKTADPEDGGAVEHKINECLAMSGLLSLRDRLGSIHSDVTENWYDLLTPGEAQRISFARIFYHMPPFVFLDEATSALSEKSEDSLYSKLMDLGITFMSIGQRSSLMKFHHQLLTLKTDGSWSLDGIILS